MIFTNARVVNVTLDISGIPIASQRGSRIYPGQHDKYGTLIISTRKKDVKHKDGIVGYSINCGK